MAVFYFQYCSHSGLKIFWLIAKLHFVGTGLLLNYHFLTLKPREGFILIS